MNAPDSGLTIENSAVKASSSVFMAAGRGARERPRSDQVLDAVALLAQLLVGRAHARAAELVDLEPLHDRVAAVRGRDRVGVDDALGDAVAAVRRHAHADEVSG